MKRVYIAAVFLLVILIGTISHSIYIDSFTQELTGLLTEAETKAGQGDWDGAEALTQTAREKWESHETYLHILLRHSETDTIYSGFREATQFIQCQEPEEYFASNSRLISALELLSEAEQLTVKNVL